MSAGRPIFRKRLSFKRAPDWVQCELCQRKGSHLPARFVMAIDDEEAEAKIDAEADPEAKAPAASALRLLCVDCSALVEGAIDAAEWKRRTNFCPAQS